MEVSPLTLLLFVGQAIALAVAIRRGLWRAVPSWVLYLGLATIHLATGVVADIAGRQYPMGLLYFEPAIILFQMAFTFESSLKYLGITFRGSPPESRLLLWLIPSVPAAIVLPIEIGFIAEALTKWHSQEGESLRLVYAVRLFLSITLFVVLAAVPAVARLGKRVVKPAIVSHHYSLIGYVGCAAAGYLCKFYVSFTVDFYVTIVFFILGPLICFLVWSKKMWNRSPADLEPVEPIISDDTSDVLDRGAFQNS